MAQKIGRKWFEAVEKPDGWSVQVAKPGGNEVACGLARSRAKKLETDLNGLLRELNFRPKSHGGRSRRKGHQFERDVAIALREVFPEARRHLEYQDAEANGIDLVGTDPFKFQCKKLKTYASINTIKEIECDEMFEVPILVTAADGAPWMAVLSFGDLLTLIRNR